jgi:hypothetical protein
MGSIVWYTGTIIGAWNVFFLYVVPYLWVHHWLSTSSLPFHAPMIVPVYHTIEPMISRPMSE